MKRSTYDLIVIGGGAAGLVSAKMAAGLSKTVAIVETDRLGGSCTWSGCVPSKTLIHLAALATKKNFDSSAIMEHVRSTRARIAKETTAESLSALGIDTFFGNVSFIDTYTLNVNDTTITFKKCILATGSRSFVPTIDGLADSNYVTNETIFELNHLPSDMVILGGGPIGVEMACALNTLGVKITIVESNVQILSHEDAEMSALLAQHMITQGITIKTSTQLTRITIDHNGMKLQCTQPDGTIENLTASILLVAAGRKPNIENLGLEAIGLKTTSKGIQVNSKLQTSVSNIYACGDVVGPYQFSHMAFYQAVIATRNACIPVFKKHVNYSKKIWVTFANPELAQLGLTEQEARTIHGNSIEIFRVPYGSIDRSVIDDATFGLCKIICNAKGYIIGASILGARAGELIHELQLGAHYNIRLRDFYHVIHAYPTYSELLWRGSRMAYLKHLKQNFFIKIISWFKSKR